jgi:hypothetical protein
MWEIFSRILSVEQNIVMNMNNVMHTPLAIIPMKLFQQDFVCNFESWSELPSKEFVRLGQRRKAL